MIFVAQGPRMTPAQAAELGRLLRAPGTRIAAGAWHFAGAAATPGAAGWCEARAIDHAMIPAGRRLAGLRLLALDMDSTLITIECIDEMGDLAGMKSEISAITAQAMRGEIDYPESLRRRVGLLAGLRESVLETIFLERLELTPGADRLVAACKANGVKLLLVSGGFTYFVERLREKLGLDYTASNVLEIVGGRLTGKLVGPIVDADAKARVFLDCMKALGAAKERTAAIGDGANDLKMMAAAGLSVAFRAKPAVRAQAGCALDHCGLDAVLNLFEDAPRTAA